MDTTVNRYIFEGRETGETLTVFGAIHGNEKCGTQALERLKDRLQTGEIDLIKGRLILVPIANPEAYKADKRFIDRNLNRALYPKPQDQRKAYEDHLDPQICAILDQTDYLLDIHSYTAGGPPFLFLGCKDAEEKAFAQSLGISAHFVWNWSNAFRNDNVSAQENWGTTEYLRHKGGRGVTLECGQHKDPGNADVATAAIWRAMAHVGLCSAETAQKEIPAQFAHPVVTRDFARMTAVIMNRGTQLSRDFRHFEAVRKGDVVATSAQEGVITAADDGFVILPNAKAGANTELAYLAVRDEPFPKMK
jgi:predicted deacylase